MLRRVLSFLVLLALLAVSCSSSPDEQTDDDGEFQRPQASILPPADPDALGDGTEPQAPVPENTDDGRLVVQSADFQLSTMLPDGSEAAPLTDPGTVNVQPSWAPDGSRVAWVAIDQETGAASIAADRFDRSDFREVSVETAPFYLYWDPSASRIAHLGPSTGGIDLSIAELLGEDGPTNRRVDRGEPYFLAWGPDGDELLVHASGFRLDRIDLGSATVIIDEFPADFGAAFWLEDNSLVFADTEEGEQFLVTAGSAGEGRRPLISYTGRLRFAVSNQGNRIVMQAQPGVEEDGVITASFGGRDQHEVTTASAQAEPTPTPGFDDSLDAIDEIQTGIPYIMGTFGGEPFPLSNNSAIALFPSPDGQSVAWLESSPVAVDAVTLHVDSSGSVFQSQPFIPSEETRVSYLPFFDQYGLSHDFWSPSSNLFVYAGREPGSVGPSGIWIFDRTTGNVERIADGVVASFTRTPEAAGAASAL